MKLEKGARVRIINYGHKVGTKDIMPQYIGKTGVITETTPGYMIRFDKEKEITGWFEENQVEEIVKA